MPKFKVKSPLSHDGKDYQIGDMLEVSEEAAAPLLGHTLAKPGEELTEKKPAQGAVAVDGEAERLAELRQIIAAEQDALRTAQEQLAAAQDALQAEREQLTAQRRDLQQAQEQLAAAQAELDAGRQQLAADRAEFEKAVAKANKK